MCIDLLNTCKYCDNTRKYCGNTLTNVEPILEKCVHLQVQYFDVGILKLVVDHYFEIDFTENLFKIASKLTSIVTLLANIALAGDHIFQVLAQYS